MYIYNSLKDLQTKVRITRGSHFPITPITMVYDTQIASYNTHIYIYTIRYDVIWFDWIWYLHMIWYIHMIYIYMIYIYIISHIYMIYIWYIYIIYIYVIYIYIWYVYNIYLDDIINIYIYIVNRVFPTRFRLWLGRARHLRPLDLHGRSARDLDGHGWSSPEAPKMLAPRWVFSIQPG